MAAYTLERFIYGTPFISSRATGEPTILAISSGLTDSDASALRTLVPLLPLPVDSSYESQSIALIADQVAPRLGTSGAHFVLARAQYQQPSQIAAVCEYLVIPGTVLLNLNGDVFSILTQLDNEIATYGGTHAEIPPLTVAASNPWTLDRCVTVLTNLLDEVLSGEMNTLFGLLGGILHPYPMALQHFPANQRQRNMLTQGLMMLLPMLARPYLTFATHIAPNHPMVAQLIFGALPAATPHWQVDWQQPTFDEAVLTLPYVTHLRRLWRGDMVTFVQALQALDELAIYKMSGLSLLDGLVEVTTRHQQDIAIMNGATLPTTDLMAILTGDAPPDGETHFHYVEQLLQQALAERNTEAAAWVAHELDRNPQLDENMDVVFQQMLELQPDSVYVFVRTRLGNGVTEKWLARLHDSAQRSLRVAIESGDADILNSWLNLLAREPSRYQLADVLREGMIAALSRVTDSPGLARNLLRIGVKRQAELIPTLLDNADFVNSLDDGVVRAIIEYQLDAIEAILSESRELFLLGIARALDVRKPIINTTIAQALWEIHTKQQTNILAPQFRPVTLIERFSADPTVVQKGALEILLALILRDEEDLFFHQYAASFGEGVLAGVLSTALEQSGREYDSWVTLINALLADETLSPQEAANIYAALLRDREWDDAAMPLIEQVTRLLNQYANVQMDTAILWRMLSKSNSLKNEHMMRVSSRRLLADMDQLVAEEQVVQNILRLRKAMQWNPSGLQAVMAWWRKYTRQQSLVQLQKLERAIDDNRSSDDLRAVAQTAIAVRRMIGNRSMEEFAADLNVAYNILQALSDGFDPEDGTGILVDSDTIRTEMNYRMRDLAPDVRHILAKNLKELAQLVTTLADNRSKRSFIRSDDTLERQLVRGEQEPQSAIDVMRWLSGYLDGAQKDSSDSS